jgi:ribosomal-protein-alanine N-acetyltransferase
MQVFTCLSQRAALSYSFGGAWSRLESWLGWSCDWHPRGYGSEAVAAVTEWLLSQRGVRQVRAHTLPSNAPSRRVLEKAGFTYAGVDEGEALYQRP